MRWLRTRLSRRRDRRKEESLTLQQRRGRRQRRRGMGSRRTLLTRRHNWEQEQEQEQVGRGREAIMRPNIRDRAGRSRIWLMECSGWACNRLLDSGNSDRMKEVQL